MQTAHFHRAYWCYENNLGIAKIHYESLGIFAILFENGIPQVNVNFLDKKEFSYYWQKYKKAGVTLCLGVMIDRDVELTRVIEKENVFKFQEINLEVKLENNIRYFRPMGGEWLEFEYDVFVEYKPCNSLIDVR
ncbi:hypothetical protein WKK05_12020 [Nostoc sp. UHCC 0302]|uniref:hypothetical protein n=1 Tax=Nostoc sp. UHCC 0302 TaxID=3134896 RepID=UPI00311CD46F